MSRTEENKEIIKHFVESALEFPKGTFEEVITWHLGTMNAILTDISKSLAVIADKMAQEAQNANSN